MRVTVCELPHEPKPLRIAWAKLCEHTSRQATELLLLPEFAMAEPVWEREQFDQDFWDAAVSSSDDWARRYSELQVPFVVGARPSTIGGRPFNQGYLASAQGVQPLRRKFFHPN
jgi:N-carbamoylputrescine amidase